MYRRLLTATVAALLVVACGPAGNRPVGSPSALETDRDRVELYLQAARTMRRRGNHLEASFYLEAALVEGRDEERILPLLIAAQMRSGRLRAAWQSVRRLRAIQSDRPYLDEVEDLLSLFDTGGTDEHGPLPARRIPVVREEAVR